MRRHDKIKRYGFVLIIMLMLAVMIRFAVSEQLKVVHYTYPTTKLKLATNPLKIALITDLHSCFYGENQHEIMDILTAEQPDIMLLVGDIYDDVLAPQHTDILLSQLQQLKAKHQIYYVNGNHELWLPKQEYQQLEQKINAYGIQILHGIGQPIPQTNIKIWGVADPVSGQFEQQLKQVGLQAKADDFNILMSHRPEHIDVYQQYTFDLVVSGHAHGGQWRVPYLINGVFAPNQGFFPRYAGGFYDIGTTKMVVSRGLARESTRYIPRIFNRPELVFITLES